MPRHVSSHFAEMNFALSKTDRGYVALCLVCGKYLKNTATKRIEAHRNVCKEQTVTSNPKTENTGSEEESDMPSATKTITYTRTCRTRGDVWKFYKFDKETKRVTCKYCNKQYKHNATRMQEHLNACAPFQLSDDRVEFDSKKYRSKDEPAHSRVIEDIETDYSQTEEVINLDSDLIKVEHRYNSVTPSHLPQKRRYEENKRFGYATYSKEERRDEFDTFGEHVANELRKIGQNAVLLANTKHELNEVLHKAVIESLKPGSYVQLMVEEISSL